MDEQFKALEQQQEETRYGCLGISIIAVILVCGIVIACKFVEHFTSEEDATPTPAPASELTMTEGVFCKRNGRSVPWLLFFNSLEVTSE